MFFCDVMYENNYVGWFLYICDLNVEVNLKVINGKYEIYFIIIRDIVFGEELVYNYYSCMDNMKEVEMVFCLCGVCMC